MVIRLEHGKSRSEIIAILKPKKPADDAKSYRPISLLCVPLKLLERLLLARLEPVIDPQLPPQQAGFRHGRSTTDQVTLLTDDIEAGFEAKQKVGVVLVDLTAAYDTVWLRGLYLKLLRMVPDVHMVSFVMELLTNRSFKLKTSDGQVSRLRRFRNGAQWARERPKPAKIQNIESKCSIIFLTQSKKYTLGNMSLYNY